MRHSSLQVLSQQTIGFYDTSLPSFHRAEKEKIAMLKMMNAKRTNHLFSTKLKKPPNIKIPDIEIYRCVCVCVCVCVCARLESLLYDLIWEWFEVFRRQ